MRNSNFEESPFEDNSKEDAILDFPEPVSLTSAFNAVVDNQSEATYSKMTVNELKTILSDRNLPTSGRKADLIQRLLDE